MNVVTITAIHCDVRRCMLIGDNENVQVGGAILPDIRGVCRKKSKCWVSHDGNSITYFLDENGTIRTKLSIGMVHKIVSFLVSICICFSGKCVLTKGSRHLQDSICKGKQKEFSGGVKASNASYGVKGTRVFSFQMEPF